jgi:hypothetical protein
VLRKQAMRYINSFAFYTFSHTKCTSHRNYFGKDIFGHTDARLTLSPRAV